MTIPEIINYYQDKGIFIEIIAIGYETQVRICWRAIVRWHDDNEWTSEDCGCLEDWEKTFQLAVNFIEVVINGNAIRTLALDWWNTLNAAELRKLAAQYYKGIVFIQLTGREIQNIYESEHKLK